MPNVLAFGDLLEQPENLRPLFNKTFLENRNVWFVNYRNTFGASRHESMSAEEIADDVIRFMDQNQITMASVIGHGFGGKIAVMTGVLKYHRITSVIGLDYSPQDYTKHAVWKELKDAVELAADINLSNKSRDDVVKIVKEKVQNARLASNVVSNLKYNDKGELQWASDMKLLKLNMNLKDQRDNIGKFPLIGCFPGRSMFLFAENSGWVHQSSNTIPIYNVFPQLLRQYGRFVDHYDTSNHWLHETEHAKTISRRIGQFYKWYDGVDLQLNDRSEIGKLAVPVRSRESLTEEEMKELVEVGNPQIPKIVPIHRHHNWAYNRENNF